MEVKSYNRIRVADTDPLFKTDLRALWDAGKIRVFSYNATNSKLDIEFHDVVTKEDLDEVELRVASRTGETSVKR